MIGLFANAVASALVGLLAKYGVNLDPLAVSGIIVAIAAPVAWWVRSKVWPQVSIEKLQAQRAQQ